MQIVLPVNDIMPHDEESTVCPCGPKVEFIEGEMLIVHNSFDGRELREREKMVQAMNVYKEMPKYQSHKIVWAFKIKDIIFDRDLARKEGRETTGKATIYPEEEGYASFEVSVEYVVKHRPQVGGYYVRYEDGYESWSPAKAFEEGYTKIP